MALNLSTVHSEPSCCTPMKITLKIFANFILHTLNNYTESRCPLTRYKRSIELCSKVMLNREF